jgi:hypothetical protein
MEDQSERDDQQPEQRGEQNLLGQPRSDCFARNPATTSIRRTVTAEV